MAYEQWYSVERHSEESVALPLVGGFASAGWQPLGWLARRTLEQQGAGGGPPIAFGLASPDGDCFVVVSDEEREQVVTFRSLLEDSSLVETVRKGPRWLGNDVRLDPRHDPTNRHALGRSVRVSCSACGTLRPRMTTY